MRFRETSHLAHRFKEANAAGIIRMRRPKERSRFVEKEEVSEMVCVCGHARRFHVTPYGPCKAWLGPESLCGVCRCGEYQEDGKERAEDNLEARIKEEVGNRWVL